MLKRILLCLCAFSYSQVSFSRTCAEVYRQKAQHYRNCAWLGILDLPIEFTTFGIGGCCLRDARQRAKVASLLESTSRIKHHPNPIDIERVKKFYTKHVLDKYPKTKLTLSQVTDQLNYLDQYGVELGVCKDFGYLVGDDYKTGRFRVAAFLFPNGELNPQLDPAALEKLRQEKERNEREREELEEQNELYLKSLERLTELPLIGTRPNSPSG